jgi:hypothetical protein
MHFRLGLALFFTALPAIADNSERRPAVLMKEYTGPYQSEFATQFDRVRLLAHQAQLEVSARLGLAQYREGFQYPVIIRFSDGAPEGLESPLAYVSLMKSVPRDSTMVSPAIMAAAPTFQQEIVINLEEVRKQTIQFDTVFFHEMTHAVLNDAVGGEAAMKIPRWLQEGLAMYVSDEGERRVRKAAEKLKRSQTSALLYSLDAEPVGKAYPQYYLAVKYILDKHSINALQALIRNLIAGRTIDEAIQDALGISRSDMYRNIAAYSKTTFEGIAIPDGFVNPNVTPSAIKSRLTGFSKN